MSSTVTPIAESAHVTTGAAALVLGCTRHRVLTLAARGLLQPVSVASHVFFERAQVEALAKQIAAEATSRVTKRARSRS
jgi:hypothetical protein